jgi:single-strand DNA-binding protein
MINRVVLVGRLTKDPELRRTAGDIPVVTFTLAINRPYAKTDQDQQADFINCTAWRRQAETVHQYLTKGSLVGVEGRIQTRNYEDAQGQRRVFTEVLADSVQFLEPKGSSSSQRPSASSQSPYDYQDAPSNSSYDDEPIIDIPDDDLPF